MKHLGKTLFLVVGLITQPLVAQGSQTEQPVANSLPGQETPSSDTQPADASLPADAPLPTSQAGSQPMPEQAKGTTQPTVESPPNVEEKTATVLVEPPAGEPHVGELRIGVAPLVARGVDEEIALALTDVLAVELEKFDDVQIVGHQDVKQALKHQVLVQLVGCEAEQCLVDIPAMLQVDKLVFGSVSKVGGSLSISLGLLDRKTGKAEARSNQTLSGDSQRLIAAVQAAVFNLMSAARGELEGESISVGTVEDLRVAQQPKTLDAYFQAGVGLYIDLEGSGLLGAPGLSLRGGADYNVLDWLLVGLVLSYDGIASQHSRRSYFADIPSGTTARNLVTGKMTLDSTAALARVTMRKSYGLILPYVSVAAGPSYHFLWLSDEHVEPLEDQDTLPINPAEVKNKRTGTNSFGGIVEAGAGVEFIFFKYLALVFDARIFRYFHDMKMKSQLTGMMNTDEYSEDFPALQGVSFQMGLMLQL